MPLPVIKDLFKIYFQEMEKLVGTRDGTKWFPLARKSISISQNEEFAEK